ncbi:cell division FtsK/SpoIIIE [Oscillochloris trichoides DG-6]|uniref:Cell division FtsK/SpoIIIE n=1 Tax=Oscillochloris trichoides DG-6 TaxID=765420 RepID=E1IEN1_9CHLR|nr:FtsK/SpoIIIE domain-containing protein [Oscillochloris trichoides]EFO80323.1 cell division FtsK/SpoIIIE [Oscillochloris trichoides DG-6]
MSATTTTTSVLTRLGLRPTTPTATIPATLPGAGRALAQPPGIEASLAYMQRVSPNDRYLLPLGWHLTQQQRPDLVHTALVGETNHILISGASDSGKDNLAWWMLLALALMQPDPKHLQIGIIDGKGLDFQPWQNKAQTWALATDPEAIPTTMRALSAKRQRRRDILATAGVSKWEHYQGNDLPLLVIFISELSLLDTALKRERLQKDRDRTLDLDLDAWLNTELTTGRAFGMRYLIGIQTVTGMEMVWRSQIGVFMGGYQPDESQVKPNTGKTAKQIAASGAVPPNLLPPPPTGAGVFTVVSGEQCVTVRAPYLSDSERRRWLSNIQDRPQAEVPVEPIPQQETETPNETSLTLPPTEIAIIGARIALGHTKTAIVRAIPDYDTRRHREFAAYYERIAAELAGRGVVKGGG